MFDQLMDLLDREKRPGGKKRGGLRGLLQQLGECAESEHAESATSHRRRNRHEDDWEDDLPSSRRRERDGFDFD